MPTTPDSDFLIYVWRLVTRHGQWDHTVHEKLFTLHRQKNRQHGLGCLHQVQDCECNIFWIEDGESQKEQS